MKYLAVCGILPNFTLYNPLNISILIYAATLSSVHIINYIDL